MSKVEAICGIHAVTALFEKRPHLAVELFLDSQRRDSRTDAIEDLAREHNVRVQRITKDQLEHRANYPNHQGVVLMVDVANKDDLDLVAFIEENPGKKLLFLVLDGVQDPHNLGACLRSADAFAVDAVILPKNNTASITQVVRKVACGAYESIPCVRVTNLARTLNELQDLGVWAVGFDGEARDTIDKIDGTRSLAIVMGAEGDGMRRLTKETCSQLVKIPMTGSVSSLNLSVATGIALYVAAAKLKR